MKKEEISKRVKLAYNYGYKMFKNGDEADVNGFIETLKSKGYFDVDTIDDVVIKTVREKLEKLFIKNGFDPYWLSK